MLSGDGKELVCVASMDLAFVEGEGTGEEVAGGVW